MNIQKLDHFTLRTPYYEETRLFFEDVAGLKSGPRPAFQFPGYWLYAGDTPLVHMAPHNPEDKQLTAYLGERQISEDTGVIDHIALRCQGLPTFEARLHLLNKNYRARTVPACGEHQVFVKAPGDLTVEFIFSSSEPASWITDASGVAVDIRGASSPESKL
jgi:catechol 2,3-dioxygenase-like lactoylglutathione lyase family enzyme